MGNLIEIFRRKDVREISRIDRISSKTIGDVLRPIHFLKNIFGFRVFEFRGHSRPILSLIYSMTLCCLHYVGTFYRDKLRINTIIHKLDIFIFHIVTTIYHIVIFVILIMGLYRSEVSLRIVYDVLIFTICSF